MSRIQLTEIKDILQAFKDGVIVYGYKNGYGKLEGSLELREYPPTDEFWIDKPQEKSDLDKVKEIIKTGYVRNKERCINYLIHRTDFNGHEGTFVYVNGEWIKTYELIHHYESITREQFLGIEE